MNLPFTI